MPKVENAIILAAGISKRFVPLSSKIPKGLLPVRNEVLLEREILQLQEAGIKDITIVVGYLHEKFMYLREKYGVNIVFNKDYRQYNNTASLMCVLDKLSTTYICSSDNYFTQNVFEPYVDNAYYAAVHSDGPTNEYCLTANDAGIITDVTIGGSNAWYMLGHVCFTQEFSNLFKEILVREFQNTTTRTQLWENLYMRYLTDLKLYIKKYNSGIIYEFDTLDELKQFDSAYENNSFIENLLSS